MEEKFHSNGHL